MPPAFVEDVLAAVGAGVALGLTLTAVRQGLETATGTLDARLYGLGARRVLVSQARNPSALAAWREVVDEGFPAPSRTALVEVPSDWRLDDAAEMGRLLAEGFERLTLVAKPGNATIQNLCGKIQHPALRVEKSWKEALDRIFGEAGPSDFIFVGSSTRAASDQANEECNKRNMVRLS
jgi:hypothetical protein